MKKIRTPLLVLAIIAMIGLNSLAFGRSIGYSVKTGDEFFYEFKYAKYSLTEQVIETEKNDVITGMVKVFLLDVDYTTADSNSSLIGAIKERIWYRTTDTGYELIETEKTFPSIIRSTPSHNLTTFGSTAIKDGLVTKDVISSFIREAPVVIPTGINASYYDSLFVMFTGQLAVAYNGINIEQYTITGSSCVVNPLQPSGAYSLYKIEISYNTDGVLEYYRVLSLLDEAHIIFSFERIELESTVTDITENGVDGFPMGLIAIVSILTLLILKRKQQKM